MFVLVGEAQTLGTVDSCADGNLERLVRQGIRDCVRVRRKKRQQFDLDTPFSSIRDCVQGSVANSECVPS